MEPPATPHHADRLLLSVVLSVSSVLCAVHALAILAHFGVEMIRAILALVALVFAVRIGIRAWRAPTLRGLLSSLALLCVGVTLTAPQFINLVRRAIDILDAMARFD